MRTASLALLTACLLFQHIVMAGADKVPGLLRITSDHSTTEVLDRLESLLRSKGMTIFARVPHSKAAAGVGIEMRDTELLIFGNPKLGSKLMLCAQTAAIDLPMKALAYRDDKGQTWLAYNDPAWLAGRHDAQDCQQVIDKMSGALRKFSSQAAGKAQIPSR